MNGNRPAAGRIRFAWLLALLLLASTTWFISASEDSLQGNQTPYWKRSLPSSTCPGSADTNCHRASPVLVDMTGDGKLEIVVATNRGHVLVYRHDGSLVWDKDVAPAFKMRANSQRIASSPAVADIDADGRPEVVVGIGTVHRSVCTQGGVIVLEDDGSVKNGWPFLTDDYSIPPSGCRDSVFSTPALGDLDKDGDLEIVFGSFDKRVYAMNHSGTMLGGFPLDSHHLARFGWDVLRKRLADTIWSSPALADLNGDGYLDIVIGSDEGNFDNSWLPVVNDWYCPYAKVETQGYCGGSIYAVDRFGKSLPGFPQYKLEIIQSTPAAYDIDQDGRFEFFVASGDYYYENSPDRPRYGFRFYGIDSDGRDLRGWSGGKELGGIVTASPAFGDLDGDGTMEVVVPARDKKLYAFHFNGNPVNGFPMTPRTRYGHAFGDFRTGLSPVLGDYNGDGTMEIFLRTAWEIVVIDGMGRQLTARSTEDNAPSYATNGPLWNTPAVGDLDGDGRLELVAQNSELYVWRLPASSEISDWPMFKQNAARTSAMYPPEPDFEYGPTAVRLLSDHGEYNRYVQPINLLSRRGTLEFQLNTDNKDAIRLPVRSGTVEGEQRVDVVIHASNDLALGRTRLGTIRLTILQDGEIYETLKIPVEVMVMRNMRQSYLPLVK